LDDFFDRLTQSNKYRLRFVLFLLNDKGDWHMIYVRVNCWAKKAALPKAFLHLQQIDAIRIKVDLISLDFTCIKVHPDGMGALKKQSTVR